MYSALSPFMDMQRSLVADIASLKKRFDARGAQAAQPVQPAPSIVAPAPVVPVRIPPPVPAAPVLPMSPSAGSPLRDMSDSDSEGEGGSKIDQRKSAKRSWAGKMFDYLDDVQRPAVQEPDKTDSWWGMKL